MSTLMPSPTMTITSLNFGYFQKQSWEFQRTISVGNLIPLSSVRVWGPREATRACSRFSSTSKSSLRGLARASRASYLIYQLKINKLVHFNDKNVCINKTCQPSYLDGLWTYECFVFQASGAWGSRMI